MPPRGRAIFVIDPHGASSTGEYGTPRAPSDLTFGGEIAAHQVQLGSWRLGRMHRNFGGRHREDQLTVTTVNRSQVENLSAKPTISISVLAVQDQMAPNHDSYWLIRNQNAPSPTDTAPDPNEGYLALLPLKRGRAARQVCGRTISGGSVVPRCRRVGPSPR